MHKVAKQVQGKLDLLPTLSFSVQFIFPATVSRESRDGLALCQFKEDIVVEYNKHRHVYLSTFTKGLLKKVHANGYGMISEERHNGNYK